MKRNLTRRDFLKLSGLLPLGMAAPRLFRDLGPAPARQRQNVLIVVFDAFSALHIPFYGYGRETTPNLARLAGRAVVYHNHHAGGNFTTPGTATLLTGTLPWTHRAFRTGSSVIQELVSRNIFNAFQGYYRTSYSHNGWANIVIKQFRDEIDEYVPQQNLFLKSYDEFIHTLFHNDDDAATVGWVRDVDYQEGTSYSLFFSHLYKMLQKRRVADTLERFPRGIPSTTVQNDINFVLEQAVDWLDVRAPTYPRPFLGYFHFLPPHAPYRTTKEFYNRFANDGFTIPEKPMDIFADPDSNTHSTKERTEYDEFILYVDQAFGDLFDSLEKSGVLDNTWLVLTSDHGEMFERGIYGHKGPTLYEPVLRVPLLIFEPGRKTGMDIYTPTSAVDVMPTLLHLNGLEIPDWAEGSILPPYAPEGPDPNRSIYAVTAEKNGQYDPLTIASMAAIKGRYKLIYYFGYPQINGGERVQLFDLESDPGERVDLSASNPDIVRLLLAETKAKIAEANQRFE